MVLVVVHDDRNLGGVHGQGYGRAVSASFLLRTRLFIVLALGLMGSFLGAIALVAGVRAVLRGLGSLLRGRLIATTLGLPLLLVPFLSPVLLVLVGGFLALVLALGQSVSQVRRG